MNARALLAGVFGLFSLLPTSILADAVTVDAVMVNDTGRDAYTHPFAGLSEAERARFFEGRSLFRQSWIASPSADSQLDGLGPLYNRLACISCHARNGRGNAPERPGERMQSMLLRLSVPGIGAHGEAMPHPAYGDQFNEEGNPGVPGEGRAETVWTPSETSLAGGEIVQLRRPAYSFSELAYGPLDGVQISARIGQPVYGMGLLDAVSAAELQRMAAELKPDGVGGRVNMVWDAASASHVVGRLGFKANMPNLRQQIAGAMLGDLGISSPLFPQQNCTPAQTACRQAPHGGEPELTAAQLDDLEFYLAHLAVPQRRGGNDPQVGQGEHLFATIGCTACHRPLLVTGEHPRFPRLSQRAIAPYSDLLLHDLGDDLADHRPDFLANGREWRTAPLWGIGLAEKVGEQVGYLHDGRARNVQEAILWHGGEAAPARGRFAALSPEERQALLAFIGSL